METKDIDLQRLLEARLKYSHIDPRDYSGCIPQWNYVYKLPSLQLEMYIPYDHSNWLNMINLMDL